MEYRSLTQMQCNCFYYFGLYTCCVCVCVFACGSRGQMLGVFFLLISFIVFYFYLKKIYYMPVSVCCICICLWRPEEGVGSPRVRVRDGCELPNVGARNPARTLQAYINCQAVTSVAVPLILTDCARLAGWWTSGVYLFLPLLNLVFSVDLGDLNWGLHTHASIVSGLP